jgi:serine/threonine-protein kinase RsbT
MGPDVRIPINHEADIIGARQKGRTLAAGLGFTVGELALVATAISEIARNVIAYAGRGELTIRIVQNGSRRAVEIVVEDKGPGIINLEQAMQDGYSTGNGLGLGLPGAKRLMDDFEIDSRVGEGTRVVMRKWAK